MAYRVVYYRYLSILSSGNWPIRCTSQSRTSAALVSSKGALLRVLQQMAASKPTAPSSSPSNLLVHTWIMTLRPYRSIWVVSLSTTNVSARCLNPQSR